MGWNRRECQWLCFSCRDNKGIICFVFQMLQMTEKLMLFNTDKGYFCGNLCKFITTHSSGSLLIIKPKSDIYSDYFAHLYVQTPVHLSVRTFVVHCRLLCLSKRPYVRPSVMSVSSLSAYHSYHGALILLFSHSSLSICQSFCPSSVLAFLIALA